MAGTEVPKGDGNGGEFVRWPDWNVQNIPSLAEYVSLPALDETGLPVPDSYTYADPAKGKRITQAGNVSVEYSRIVETYLVTPPPATIESAGSPVSRPAVSPTD